MALFEKADLRAGQSVLIHAASGGVGTFAVQLAKVAGARVIGTTSGRNVDLVKSLGADEVIDYRSEDFSTRVKDVDVVFDTRLGATRRRNLSACYAKGACWYRL
jgi:NADPH:quinone reductase-like Zn-dependent oxidoreductase